MVSSFVESVAAVCRVDVTVLSVSAVFCVDVAMLCPSPRLLCRCAVECELLSRCVDSGSAVFRAGRSASAGQ